MKIVKSMDGTIEDCQYCETGNKIGLCALHKQMEAFFDRGVELKSKITYADGNNPMALPYDINR